MPFNNHKGKERIIHQITLLMNPHNSFADLKTDTIAEITENACMQAFGPMFANLAEYGITNMNKLEAEGLSIFDMLYIFLSQLKDGGAKNVALGLYQIKVTDALKLKQYSDDAEELKGVEKADIDPSFVKHNLIENEPRREEGGGEVV